MALKDCQVRDLLWTAEVYARLVGVRLRVHMQYRLSLALLTVGSFLATGMDLIALLIIMQRTPHLAGWTLGEIAFLYGACSVSFALTEFVIGGFDLLPQSIQRGEFDRVLARPVGAFLQTLAADFQPQRLGRLAQGVAALALAALLAPVPWTPLKVLYFPVMLVSGAVIFGAVFVTGAAVCFWTVRTSEVTNIFTYGGVQLSSYPLSIYADWLRRLVVFIVPLAFINYFPALWLLDKDDPLGMPGVFPFVSPLVAVLAALVARAAWSAGVRHYASTGS